VEAISQGEEDESMNPFNAKKFAYDYSIEEKDIEVKTTKPHYEMIIKGNWYYNMRWFPKNCRFDVLTNGIRFWVERKK